MKKKTNSGFSHSVSLFVEPHTTNDCGEVLEIERFYRIYSIIEQTKTKTADAYSD